MLIDATTTITWNREAPETAHILVCGSPGKEVLIDELLQIVAYSIEQIAEDGSQFATELNIEFNIEALNLTPQVEPDDHEVT